MSEVIVFIDNPEVTSEDDTGLDIVLKLKPEEYDDIAPVVIGFTSSEHAEDLGDACYRAAKYIREEGRER